jgi:hypothetical protein
MTIDVPVFARGHFWEEPPPDSEEFWAYRDRPACEPGEPLLFRFDGQIVASAVCSRIEEPGASECEGTGRFKNGWKVFWAPESFQDLRQPSTVCTRCGGGGRYMRQDAPRAGERFRYVMTDCPCGQGAGR